MYHEERGPLKTIHKAGRTAGVISRIVHQVLELLYPPVCPFCGEVWRGEKEEGICPRCRMAVPVVTEPFCMRCGKPIDDANDEYCHDCGSVHHSYEQGRALYPHTGVQKQAVYDLKYAGRQVNGEIFGRELASHFADWIRMRQITLIVPVPLHRKRFRDRGYNQAAVIARSLVRELREQNSARMDGVPGLREDVLSRVRMTRRLKTMKRAGRKRALQGAFEADLTGVPEWQRQNILLIDDIYTTGSTIDEAARSLKRAGAEKVYFLTVTIGLGM